MIENFNPLYSTVLPAELEACHWAVRSGGDLSKAVEGRSATWVKEAYESSGEAEAVADIFIRLSPKAQATYPLDGLSDFTLATLYTILMESGFKEAPPDLRRRYDEIFIAILSSETASPLLDYVWIFTDAVQYAIDVLGESFRAVLVRAPVLDLTSRKDIASVAAKLAGVEVKL